MKRSQLLFSSTFLILLFALSGCAVVFSPRHQKVEIASATPDATIKLNNDSIGKSSKVVKLDKYQGFYNVTVEKEGYKSKNYCFGLEKLSPTIAFAVLDVGVSLTTFFFMRNVGRAGDESATGTTHGKDKTSMGAISGGFLGLYLIPKDFHSSRTHMFNKKQMVPALVPLDKRQPDEKYMLVNKTAVDVKAADIAALKYRGLKKYNGGITDHNRLGSPFRKSRSNEDLKVENSIFTYGLNHELKKMNFIDTTRTVFTNTTNTIYVDATIKKITFHNVLSKYRNNEYNGVFYPANSALSVEMDIDWDVLDYYKEKVCTIHTHKTSDLFVADHFKDDEAMSKCINKAVQDNLEYSILDVKSQLAVKGLMKITTTKDTLSYMELPSMGGKTNY